MADAAKIELICKDLQGGKEMPNWCSNTACITGSPETLQWLQSTHFNFEILRPRPADQEDNWYEWNVANWGTKWVAQDIEMEMTQDGSLVVTFRTAWCAPAALLTFVANQHHLKIRNEYVGECFEFVGQDIYGNGQVVSEYVELADMSDVDVMNFAMQHRWFPYDDWRNYIDLIASESDEENN